MNILYVANVTTHSLGEIINDELFAKILSQASASLIPCLMAIKSSGVYDDSPFILTISNPLAAGGPSSQKFLAAISYTEPSDENRATTVAIAAGAQQLTYEHRHEVVLDGFLCEVYGIAQWCIANLIGQTILTELSYHLNWAYYMFYPEDPIPPWVKLAPARPLRGMPLRGFESPN